MGGGAQEFRGEGGDYRGVEGGMKCSKHQLLKASCVAFTGGVFNRPVRGLRAFSCNLLNLPHNKDNNIKLFSKFT